MGMSISMKQSPFPVLSAGESGSMFQDWDFCGGVDPVTSEDPREQDMLELSQKGKLLSMEELIDPTEPNVRQLSAELSKELAGILSAAGISAQPPIEIDVDERTAEIRVRGDRADKEKILDLIHSSGDIETRIRNVTAISSHVVHIAEHLKFQKEYLASGNPENVVARYSYLFGPQGFNDLSLLFDGEDIQVLSDGKPCIS